MFTCQILGGGPSEHDHPCVVVNMQKCYVAVFLSEYKEHLQKRVLKKCLYWVRSNYLREVIGKDTVQQGILVSYHYLTDCITFP